MIELSILNFERKNEQLYVDFRLKYLGNKTTIGKKHNS